MSILFAGANRLLITTSHLFYTKKNLLQCITIV